MGRCTYVWERRTPGKRYVNARGHCKRNATAPCGRCSEHCPLGTNCEHYARKMQRVRRLWDA